MQTDLWTYRDATELGYDPASGRDLTGFNVEAIDGSVGKVDAATNRIGASLLVVDTGGWIFGKQVLIPAGIIKRVDEADEAVWVNRTRDQIKGAPEYDDALLEDSSYRAVLGSYYGEDGTGYRSWDDM